jgi:hypothetical protein
MWIKKSHQELTSDLRARRLAAGLCALTATSLVCVYGLPHAAWNIPAGDRILGVLVAGVFLLAWHRSAHQHRIRSHVCVCQQCNLVKVHDYEGTCLCGGKFTSMCELRWLAKPVLTVERSPDPMAGKVARPSHAV